MHFPVHFWYIPSETGARFWSHSGTSDLGQRGLFVCFFALVSSVCQFLHVFLSLHLITGDFNKGQEVSHSVRLTTFWGRDSPPPILVKDSMKTKVKYIAFGSFF